MIAPSGLETRDVTVGSALQRHQLRSYLKAASIDYLLAPDAPNWEQVFRITASPAQWEKVDEWIERIKEGR